VRGELVRARNQADRAVVAADRAGIAPAERPAATAVALAWVAVEEYDLQSALDHVDQARACPGLRDDPVSKALLALVEARLQRARGDLLDAIATVERAGAREDCGSWLGDQLRVEAASLRVLADGTVPELADLRGGLEPEVALVASQARRVQGEDIAAEDRLDRALAPDVPLATQVSAWLLKVGQELDHGRLDRARTALDRALGLAAKQTLRRPFREAGAPVQEMLDAHPELGRRNPWLGWEQGTPAPAIPGQRVGGSNGHGRRPEDRMVEHLTAKELEVLGHLAELLSTEEVAATMFVSVNTVRTHVRNILRKLEVSRRNDAIRRARDLHLLDR
jgi:LuxR family maltose regulon positive regulatory protein